MNDDLLLQTYSSYNRKQSFEDSNFLGWNSREQDQHKNQINQLNQIYEYLHNQAIENVDFKTQQQPSKSVDVNEKKKYPTYKMLKSPKNKTPRNKTPILNKDSYSVHQRSSTIAEQSYEYPIQFPKISVTKVTIKHRRKNNNKSPELKKMNMSIIIKNSKRLKTDRVELTREFHSNNDAQTKENIIKQDYYNFMKETPIYEDAQQIKILSVSEQQKKFSYQNSPNLRYEDCFTRREILRQKQVESMQKNHRQLKIPVVSFHNSLENDQNNQSQQSKSRPRVDPLKKERNWHLFDHQEIQKAKEQIKVSTNKIIPLSQILGLNQQPSLNNQIKRLVQFPIIVSKPLYPRPIESKPNQIQELKLK